MEAAPIDIPCSGADKKTDNVNKVLLRNLPYLLDALGSRSASSTRHEAEAVFSSFIHASSQPSKTIKKRELYERRGCANRCVMSVNRDTGKKTKCPWNLRGKALSAMMSHFTIPLEAFRGFAVRMIPNGSSHAKGKGAPRVLGSCTFCFIPVL